MAHGVLTTTKQNFWKGAYTKETHLRLKWFQKNEGRLKDIANRKPVNVLPKEYKLLIEKNRLATYQNAERQAGVRQEIVVPDFEDIEVPDIMKPIDPEVKNLLYTGTNDGRLAYLKKRVKLLPEERYYYQETSNFEYGWKMCPPRENLGFGRQKLLQDALYRRNGVQRDPDWYREPSKLSPTTCGTI